MLDAIDVIKLRGTPGHRYDDHDVAEALGIPVETVRRWLAAGLLHGAWSRYRRRWMIRLKAIRRAIADVPQIQASVARARLRAIETGELIPRRRRRIDT